MNKWRWGFGGTARLAGSLLLVGAGPITAGWTKGHEMKAFLVLTEAQPRIIATPKEPRSQRHLVSSLSKVGIDRFIAHEVDIERLREIYGFPFDVIEKEIRKGKDFQVVDSNGQKVLAQIRRADLGPSIAHNF